MKLVGNKKMLVGISEQCSASFLKLQAKQAGISQRGNRSDVFKRLKAHYAKEVRCSFLQSDELRKRVLV